MCSSPVRVSNYLCLYWLQTFLSAKGSKTVQWECLAGSSPLSSIWSGAPNSGVESFIDGDSSVGSPGVFAGTKLLVAREHACRDS
jgi:hypothetical protein